MAAFSLALCAVYSIFLVIGGFAFMYLEFEIQESIIIVEEDEWKHLKEILHNPNLPEEKVEVEEGRNITSLVLWLQDRCPKLPNSTYLNIKMGGNQSHVTDDIIRGCPDIVVEIREVKYHYPWNFVDSLYFAMTVATTIGYGHISPSTAMGRIVCIVYATFGIPLTMVLLSCTSNFFGERLFLIFEAKLDKQKRVSKLFIALGTIFYISVGFIVFIFLPAIIFMKIENWTYLEGVYYAFITLTTIGFGDFVSAKSMDGYWMYIYQISVILWIMTGLGYWVMVANFMTRAIRSKKMQSFARKATDLKKLLNQVGLTHSDPKFLSQHSKATMNFMLQLGSALVMPEVSDNEGLSNNTSAGAPLTPPAIPGIASLFGQAGLGGMMTSMTSTTGRVCTQSEALIKTAGVAPPPDGVPGTRKLPGSVSKNTNGKPSTNHTVDVQIDQPAIEPVNHFRQHDGALCLKAKSSREPKSSFPSTPSAKNLLSSSSSPDSDHVDEEVLAIEPPGHPPRTSVDQSDLQAGIEINFTPSAVASKHSIPNKYNSYSDSKVWEDSDSFSIKL